jgi:hypothetical protein
MTAIEVFTQNDGDVTKAYYADMNQRGPSGQLAVALFRARSALRPLRSIVEGSIAGQLTTLRITR